MMCGLFVAKAKETLLGEKYELAIVPAQQGYLVAVIMLQGYYFELRQQY